MSRLKYTLAVVIVILTILLAGCIAPTNKPSTSSSTGTSSIGGQTGSGNPSQTGTVGVDNSPQTGTLVITSSPFGADVYLNGTYVGNTTLTLTNQTPGSVPIMLKLKGYARYNGTATVVANQVVKFSGTLSKAKSNVQINDLYAKQTSPCYFDITGTISNTGDAAAQGVLLTLSLTPATYDQKLDYVPMKFTQTIGTLNPGDSLPIGFGNIHIACGGDFTTTVDYVGQEIDPVSGASTSISGSATVD